MVTETYELTLPKSFGVKISNNPKRHGGLGRDRSNIRVLKEVKERINSSNEFQGDAASWTLTCQQLSEENDILQKKNVVLTNQLNGNKKGKENIIPEINRDVAKEAGLLINPTTMEKKQGQYFQTRKVTGEKKSTGKGGRSYHDRDPVVDPNKITDKEIHRRTSFKTLNDLLFVVVVATNGDLTLLSKTISPLTWFEEWMLFFELQSSKSIH